MRSFVNFQIFRPGEYFTTSRERTRKGFFARVHTYVIHQFVLGLKGFALSRAVLPKAYVVTLFGAPNVLHGYMRYHLVHCAESPVASLLRPVNLVLVNPFTRQFLFDGLPHVSEKRSRAMVRRYIHAHIHIDRVVVVVKLCSVGVRPRARDWTIRIRSSKNVPAQT